MTDKTISPIAYAHTPYREKFGVPRQPGLSLSAEGEIIMEKEHSREEAFQGLSGISHVWLIFGFHLNEQEPHSVKAPRLGGNQKIGVFASRAPYRPNGLGLSVVELISLKWKNDRLALRVRGPDIVDGTPIYDIKPYLPYCDQVSNARIDWVEEQDFPKLSLVEFSEPALDQLAALDITGTLKSLIMETILLDPRPATQRDRVDKSFGLSLQGLNIRFTVDADRAFISEIILT
jgi:tRNA-Thr(GGU) m(6)t(6)A37 methyltransferase TsaA